MLKKSTLLLICIALACFNAMAQTSVIPYGSNWKYLDNGSDQGTAWRAVSFDDSGWKSGNGKFGYGGSGVTTTVSYGPDASNKYITTYFRKSFTIDNPANFSSFTINMKKDDGIVVFLNGVEVYRNNVPDGDVRYNTTANKSNSSDKSKTLDPSDFTSGTNVFAVEIHQESGSSSDIGFDLELTGISTTTNPPPADVTAPSVQSINRQSPSSETTSGTSVTYRASFSEGVTGVDAADFVATTVSGSATGTVSSVAAVGTNGNTYDVTVSSITGEGAIRLDLKGSGTGIADMAGNAIASGYTAGQTYTIQKPTQGGGELAFASVTNLDALAVNNNTQDKPQSKVWFHDGKHWTVLTNDDGAFVYRLDGTTWKSIVRVSSSSYSKADCKVVGNVVHILLFRGSSSYLSSVEYVPESKTYKLWSKRTSRVSLSLDSDAETATMEVDSKGRMWVAYDGNGDVQVKWSDSPYTSWSAPIKLVSGATNDDISAIIALPGKIGVLWSDQNAHRFGFRTHEDGSAPDAWSDNEVPASQSALDIHRGMADDHLNMAVASDGTLYCAVKTEYETSGYPKLALLIRRPSGSWDNLYEVTQGVGTRPIVILNEALGKLTVVYTSSESGGNILYKQSLTSKIAFGAQHTLISGTYNFATSMKQNYDNEVVILASTSSKAVGVLATENAPAAATEPEPVIAAEAEIGATSVAVSAYPNPFRSKATINFSVPEGGEYSVSLLDGTGKPKGVLKQGKAIAGEQKELELDGSNLNKGMYIIRVQTRDGVRFMRVLLEK